MTAPGTGNVALSSKSDAGVSRRGIFMALLKAQVSEDINIVLYSKKPKRER